MKSAKTRILTSASHFYGQPGVSPGNRISGFRSLLGVAFTISTSKLLHQPVDLLSLTRKTEVLQEHSERRDEIQCFEIHQIHVSVHNLLGIPAI